MALHSLDTPTGGASGVIGMAGALQRSVGQQLGLLELALCRCSPSVPLVAKQQQPPFQGKHGRQPTAVFQPACARPGGAGENRWPVISTRTVRKHL